MTWYLLLILLVLLVSAKVFWDGQRSGRLFYTPLPHPFRDRPSQEAVWKQSCQGDVLEKVDALLRILCEAFSFNPDDRYRFAPSDRLLDVYRVCYPRWKFWNIGDNMEIESLMADLSQQFTVDDSHWHTKITLGEIVGRMQSSVGSERNPENEEQ